MIAIVDYGVGNIFSVKRALNYIGEDGLLTGDPRDLETADKIILPGVGAFGDAARKLEASGLRDVIIEQAGAGKPLLGICLGMQLLFTESLEYGVHAGLDLIPGRVVDMSGIIVDKTLKIPQIGWNGLDLPEGRRGEAKHPLFKYTEEGECVYFVHSFCAVDCGESVIATCDYSAPITAAVARGNVMGTQFHPEKSGNTGMGILKAFCEI